MNEDLAELFIHNVEERLIELGISKSELAKRLGIKPSGIAKILKKDTNPKLDTLIAVAKAVECPLHKLISEKSNPVLDQLNKLTKELHSIESTRSELHIEMNILEQKRNEKSTEEYKDWYLSHDKTKAAPIRLQNEVERLNFQISRIQRELRELSLRQNAIPVDIRRLEQEAGIIIATPKQDPLAHHLSDPFIREIVSALSSFDQFQKERALHYIQGIKDRSSQQSVLGKEKKLK